MTVPDPHEALMRRTAFLMPAFNPRPDELSRSLASMLAQTEAADIVIVDDGSKRPVSELVEPRDGVFVLRLDRNVGITAALNHGLAWIAERGYAYVARMDCDDLCKPERIALQQAHMDRNPDLDMIGAFADVVDEEGNHLFFEGTSGGPDAIAHKLFDAAAYKHPTFFYRVATVARLGAYSSRYPHAEDYEFLRRLSARGKIDCLDDVLIIYEKNTTGISGRNRRRQLWSRLMIQLAYFSPLRLAAWLGALRTLVTLMVPARIWARLARLYWQQRARRKGFALARCHVFWIGPSIGDIVGLL
jgi:glycosyltransferase involved in cell wall biosynthesis